MVITKDMLEQKILELEKSIKDETSKINMMLGAINALNCLIEELELPEE